MGSHMCRWIVTVLLCSCFLGHLNGETNSKKDLADTPDEQDIIARAKILSDWEGTRPVVAGENIWGGLRMSNDN